jgi:hypothetical protein
MAGQGLSEEQRPSPTRVPITEHCRVAGIVAWSTARSEACPRMSPDSTYLRGLHGLRERSQDSSDPTLGGSCGDSGLRATPGLRDLRRNVQQLVTGSPEGFEDRGGQEDRLGAKPGMRTGAQRADGWKTSQRFGFSYRPCGRRGGSSVARRVESPRVCRGLEGWEAAR